MTGTANTTRTWPLVRITALRLLALVALGTCGALLAEYVGASGSFCSFAGDCNSVIHSVYGRPLGVPLPVFGAIGFSLLFVLTLIQGPKAASAVTGLGLAAGVAGLVFIAVQAFVLERFCPLCLLVDSCAIAIALLALIPPEAPPTSGRLEVAAWLLGACLALLGPLAWALYRAGPSLPPEVTEQWVSDRVNVVEVTDFDCPSCRRAEPILDAFLARHADRIHFVRLPLPMPRHTNARPAALAFLAANAQGKGEAMAHALFAAPDRSAPTCRKLAGELGLDLDAYDRAVRDPKAEARLDDTILWGQVAAPGLPLIWIDDQLLYGAPRPDALDNAFVRAEERRAAKSR